MTLRGAGSSHILLAGLTHPSSGAHMERVDGGCVFFLKGHTLGYSFATRLLEDRVTR